MDLDTLVKEMRKAARDFPHRVNIDPIVPSQCCRDAVELDGFAYPINIVLSYATFARSVRFWHLSMVHADLKTRMPEADVIKILRAFFPKGFIGKTEQALLDGNIFELPPNASYKLEGIQRQFSQRDLS